MLERYFDNAATTPCDSRIVSTMLKYYEDEPGNADSIHAYGIKARAAVEQARKQVARLIGAEDPSQVFFTSGATEANNWVLSLHPEGWISPFEHSSVRVPALSRGHKVAPNQGYHVDWPQTNDFQSSIVVGNENGAITNLPEKGIRHYDATQAVGKIPFEVGDADYVSFSAHKLYGPKGVGVLYIRDPRVAAPFLLGGGQERGYRSGTLNVPGIAGLGVAAEIAYNEFEKNYEKAVKLRQIVVDELEGIRDTVIHGGPNVSPYILSASFAGIEGESLVLELDARGFAISSGAACSSSKVEPSHVLLALGISPEFLKSTVRISFGRFNTEESASLLAKTLISEVNRLRKLRKAQ